MGIFGIFSKDKKDSLDQGLQKSSENIFSKLSKAVVGKSTVDEAVLDELEEILITADVGVDTTIKVINRIEARVAKDKYVNTSELDKILREEIAALLEENNTQDPLANWQILLKMPVNLLYWEQLILSVRLQLIN
jgi:fused signal recognition particle receptor